MSKDHGFGEPLEWRVPLGREGSVAYVALCDCGYYVRWLFDNPGRADGMDLEVAIEHMNYHDFAAAFRNVTGHPARYVKVSVGEYWTKHPIFRVKNQKAAYNADPKDAAALTVEDNFTGFWNVWKYSGRNKGVVRRDYKFLDEIHPTRIKSAEE